MVLKIFTKRLPGGAPIKTGFYWNDLLIESKQIQMTPSGDGFNYTTDAPDSPNGTGSINCETHGWEIYNDTGVVIQRHVTALTDDQLKQTA